MVIKTRWTLVFHPFFFSVYAVLGVYSQNSTDVPIQWIARPLLILLLLVIVAYYALQKTTHDARYAGLVATLILFWLFFGHFERALFEKSPFWGTSWGILIAFFMWTSPLVLLGSPWTWRHISNRSLVTSFLNLTSFFVVLLPVYTTGVSIIQTIDQTRKTEALNFVNLPVVLEDQSTKPDIYLIVLDAYGREDMVQEIYGFDNSEFIGFLQQKGFYVADRSTANYPQTQLAFSSLLNMQYLDVYVKEFNDTTNRGVFREHVHHSAIRKLLQEQDYRFVALPSPTLLTQIRDADIYLSANGLDINEFEASLIASTVIGVAVESWGIDLPVMSYELHRKYTVFSLDQLRKIPEIPGPKFVLAHIMLPHPPFIFDGDGDFAAPDYPYVMWDASLFPGSTEEYQKGYTAQMTFLNRKIMDVLSDLLTHSPIPPIIILQGDHGPGAFYDVNQLSNSCLQERFSILNAYYFPDGDYSLVYPSITPVNSFRVILNKYFGAQLDLLEDKNYYASWSSPYLYTDVTTNVDLPCSISEEGMH
ncbi:MAG TPA: hypothetical protein VK897_21730 [Anaerolineales bacterium]|nr:hypothetical protein [Anaerolineales bacterium]